jgi:hypothetical protein
MGTEEIRTVRHLEHLCRRNVSYFHGITEDLLTRFHASDAADKIKNKITDWHKLQHTVYIDERKDLDEVRSRTGYTKYIESMITHYSRHLSSDGSHNPEDSLKVQHPPEIRRILLVQHAKKHNAEQGQIHEEVDKHTPAETIRPSDGTCRYNRGPHGASLNYGQCELWAPSACLH